MTSHNLNALSLRLKDKVAIITGAGRGIGREYALRFIREGAKVVIAEIDNENANKVGKEIEALGGEVLIIKTDISDERSTGEMAKKTYEKFGKIDILLNNAAVMDIPLTPAEEWPVETWEKLLRVNVIGSWLCAKAVFPYMKQQDKGKIINITSSVVWVGAPGLLPYTSSKGAILGMTRTLAVEWGQYNINVNAIAPGLTLTDVVLKTSPPEVHEFARQQQCIKRNMKSTDLAGTATFLASDDSNMITGSVIHVDGGTVQI